MTYRDPDSGLDFASQDDYERARRQASCEHDWHYDEEESAGPWTGYMERCSHCGALQQVPQ